MQLKIYISTYKYNHKHKHVYSIYNISYQYKYMHTRTGFSHNMIWMIFSINSSWGQKFASFVFFRLKYSGTMKHIPPNGKAGTSIFQFRVLGRDMAVPRSLINFPPPKKIRLHGRPAELHNLQVHMTSLRDSPMHGPLAALEDHLGIRMDKGLSHRIHGIFIYMEGCFLW